MSVTRLTKDQFIPFLDINKDKTFENSNWTRIDYSTIFELTVNEVEEDIHYICFENPITVVTSNKPELPQEIALYEGNPMYDFMFDQLYNLPIGEDCKVPFILAFGGSEKRAWRGICTISGKTLNTIDGRISFNMKIGGEITKGFYKIADGKVVFSTQNTPEPTQSCGSVATSYEPYFPSNKMLAEENTQQSTEMMDIKMLGWSVPKECPIQNEVNGNQFTQKVGRVDLGSLAFQYDTTEGHERMRTVSVLQGAKGALVDNIGNIYTSIYTRSSANYTYLHRTDQTISIDDYCVIWIYDTSYTDASTFKQAMQGQYLYYELANYNTITIDGNEEVSLLLKRIEALESLVNKTDKTTIESE